LPILRFLILAPLALAIVAAGALPWYEQLNRERVWAGGSPPAFFFSLPLMSRPQAAMVFRWLQGEDFDTQQLEYQMKSALKARPLNPDNWLLAARLKHRLGKTDEAAQLAEHAQTLGPTRGKLLWDLAMFWLAYPDQDKAISLLHDYLLARPHDVRKVIFLAYRLEDDKAKLLDKLIPAQLAPGYDFDDDFYAAKILQTALSLKNAEMAAVAWQRIEHREIRNNPNARVIKAYQAFLIHQGMTQPALSVWHDMHPELDAPSGVMNGSFEHELLGYGFGWRSTKQEGAEFERSFNHAVEGNYSLKIHFDGQQNINLYRPGITLPVKSGRSYLLTAYWKGEQITTRSNPFFEIVYKQGEKTHTVRSKPQRGDWNWQRIEMVLDVPEGTHFVELRLRRWRTEALDKLISGTLYIDDVKLTEL